MQPTQVEAILHPGDAGRSRSQDRALVSRCAVTLRRTFLTVIVLASIALALDVDSVREQSLTKRVFCNCGCREVLAECSHVECQARTPLKHEIASEVLQGKSDDRILGDLGMKYGGTILVVPAFRGFDVLLWNAKGGNGCLELLWLRQPGSITG
jgi:cytochrome c-type biogenesis protein CcmH/NrfF